MLEALILLLAWFVAVPALAILPGYLRARRRGPRSAWILLLPLPPVVLWVALMALGVGTQSPGNLAELYPISGAGVVGAYLSLFIPRVTPKRALAAMLLLTVAVRLLSPEIPE